MIFRIPYLLNLQNWIQLETTLCMYSNMYILEFFSKAILNSEEPYECVLETDISNNWVISLWFLCSLNIYLYGLQKVMALWFLCSLKMYLQYVWTTEGYVFMVFMFSENILIWTKKGYVFVVFMFSEDIYELKKIMSLRFLCSLKIYIN